MQRAQIYAFMLREVACQRGLLADAAAGIAELLLVE